MMSVMPCKTFFAAKFLLVEWTEEENFSVVPCSHVRDSSGVDPACLHGGERVTIGVGIGRQSKEYSATVLKSGNWPPLLYHKYVPCCT